MSNETQKNTKSWHKEKQKQPPETIDNKKYFLKISQN